MADEDWNPVSLQDYWARDPWQQGYAVGRERDLDLSQVRHQQNPYQSHSDCSQEWEKGCKAGLGAIP